MLYIFHDEGSLFAIIVVADFVVRDYVALIEESAIDVIA